MKQINLWSGRSYIVDEEKMKKIIGALENGNNKALVKLNDGSGFIISAIESWDNPDTKPYYMGYPMNESLTRVCVQGEWKQFAGKKEDIEYKAIIEDKTKPKIGYVDQNLQLTKK